MNRHIVGNKCSAIALNSIGYNNTYSVGNATRIINNHEHIVNKLGVEVTTRILVDLLICTDKRDSRYLYERLFCHIENNYKMFGCSFFISLFISNKLEDLGNLDNWKLKEISNSVVYRMTHRDTSYNYLTLDELNESNSVYYRMFNEFLTDVTYRVAADCSYIYSVDIDDCMDMLESTIKIINRNTNMFSQEPIDDYHKYSILQELAELSTDSAVLDFEIEYITDTMRPNNISTGNTIKEINSTVHRLLNSIDAEYDEGALPIENVQEDLEDMFSELRDSIVNSCDEDDEIIDELTPIMCDVEITMYNMITVRLIYEAITRIVLREFDTKQEAIDSFKDLLALSSYVSKILCRDKSVDIYPKLQIL